MDPLVVRPEAFLPFCPLNEKSEPSISFLTHIHACISPFLWSYDETIWVRQRLLFLGGHMLMFLNSLSFPIRSLILCTVGLAIQGYKVHSVAGVRFHLNIWQNPCQKSRQRREGSSFEYNNFLLPKSRSFSVRFPSPIMSTDAQIDPLPSVLLLRPLLPPFTSQLSAQYCFLKPWESPLPFHQFLRSEAEAVRVLLVSGLTPVDVPIIEALPGLECVVTTSAGVNHIDIAECKRRGIAVSNAGTVFSDDAADYAVGLVIDVLRRVSAADRYVRGGVWARKGDYPLASKVGGKRVGIVGLGSIGSEIAKRLQAFGCIISYNSRKHKSSVPFPYFSNVYDLAANSDVLIVSCALTSETHHIINKDVLRALGKEGVVVNVGRGALIDEKEMVRCLVNGEIGGAGLDVFEDEPNVPHELVDMDNVVLSPHRAVLTQEALSGLLQLIMANLEAFFANKPLVSPVEL